MKNLAKKIAALLASVCLLVQMPVSARAEISDEQYKLINDMVFAYKMDPVGNQKEIRTMLRQLKKTDRNLGMVWENIMDAWARSNDDFELNEGELPDDLPKDNSLGIVVLGFELKPDGEMSEELIGRCTLALECANKYPEAYVIVTGGGTARNNHDVTEADSMSAWLQEKGIDKDRIIVENKSFTTAQNAMFTYDILKEKYPEIKDVAIVSSDYHVPLGYLLFTEQFLLAAYIEKEAPIRVISNAALKTKMIFPAETIPQQATDVWAIASILTE